MLPNQRTRFATLLVKTIFCNEMIIIKPLQKPLRGPKWGFCCRKLAITKNMISGTTTHFSLSHFEVFKFLSDLSDSAWNNGLSSDFILFFKEPFFSKGFLRWQNAHFNLVLGYDHHYSYYICQFFIYLFSSCFKFSRK